MNGKLYIVSTPIGNPEDITLRALNILKSVDLVICEEFREGRRILSNYKIEKELTELNEHNEKEAVNDILMHLINGQSAALISDCGTPLFSDPGHLLVDVLISQNIQIVPVPGASSIMSALVGSGFDIEKFYYYGWLSPKTDERRGQLVRLKGIHEVLIFMDTPYRLKSLLGDVVKILGANVPVVLAYQLTMAKERYYRGSAAGVLNIAEKNNLKGEFVLIVNNRRT
jgi:16S rRNA (cytidine1402-2'-O)-methyltransferase